MKIFQKNILNSCFSFVDIEAVFPPVNSIPLFHLCLSFFTKKVNKEVKSSTSEDEGFLKPTPGFNWKDSKKTGRGDGPKASKVG